MSEFHLVYLNLGSNIQPETNLPRAVTLLEQYGEVLKVSNVWESEPVGTEGPNYLNVCVLFKSTFAKRELKERIAHSIEHQLGRRRSRDKFAPRPIDVDIVLFDDVSTNNEFWNLAYVVVPLADIYPNLQNPLTSETISETATRLRQGAWLEMRRGIFG